MRDLPSMRGPVWLGGGAAVLMVAALLLAKCGRGAPAGGADEASAPGETIPSLRGGGDGVSLPDLAAAPAVVKPSLVPAGDEPLERAELPLALGAPGLAGPAPGQAPDLAAREATRLVVRESALTYDAEAAERVAKFLNHPDAEVRAEAVKAMMVAGDIAGAALLRKAAEQIKDPREAVTYLDAADFLELPPALPLVERAK